jgi:hypothetical protein
MNVRDSGPDPRRVASSRFYIAHSAAARRALDEARRCDELTAAERARPVTKVRARIEHGETLELSDVISLIRRRLDDR